MLKGLAWVCAIFFAIVFAYYCFTTVSAALTTPGAFSFLPSVASPIGPDSSGGLSAINFSLFDKGGKGYDYITQGYGVTPYSYLYINHWHNGIDIAADYGAPIYSPTDAIVIATGDQDDYCPKLAFGRYVVIEDDTNHLVLLFAHLNQISVTPLEVVKKGQLLATVGTSGLETGPHLHFSIFESAGFNMDPAHGCGPYPTGHDVDPLDYLGTVYQ